MKTVGLGLLLILVFAAGVVSGQLDRDSLTVRGSIRSANTIDEPIEYWELRGQDGTSVTVMGHKTIPLITWMRQAKDSSVSLTISRERRGVSPNDD
ncbi:MAG TPA: hypothetical protein VGQ10_04215 [Vicinamibacterales bacterium]|jgi:hypothetical protein|nr:hypothetical protein [Vicinamibacterales bacterium]